jgi:Protein of unknown function (DUF3892)
LNSRGLLFLCRTQRKNIPARLAVEFANPAITRIESGEDSFYVQVGGKATEVIVAVHNNRKYLKTMADGYAPDNLLNLDECPACKVIA